jgi:hypothetical protein
MGGGGPKKPEKTQAELDAEKEAKRREQEAMAQQRRRDDQAKRRGFGSAAFIRQNSSVAPLTSVLGV